MIPKVKEIKALAGGKKLIGKLCAQGFQFVLCILNGNRKKKKPLKPKAGPAFVTRGMVEQ